MVTNDERREVARRLRHAWTNVPDRDPVRHQLRVLLEVYEAVGLDDGESDAIDLFGRLADLIEPEPERTCRMVSAFDTDELEHEQENISFSPEDTLAYRCGGCRFDFRYERGLYPSYCPNCGARVVDG